MSYDFDSGITALEEKAAVAANTSEVIELIRQFFLELHRRAEWLNLGSLGYLMIATFRATEGGDRRLAFLAERLGWNAEDLYLWHLAYAAIVGRGGCPAARRLEGIHRDATLRNAEVPEPVLWWLDFGARAEKYGYDARRAMGADERPRPRHRPRKADSSHFAIACKVADLITLDGTKQQAAFAEAADALLGGYTESKASKVRGIFYRNRRLAEFHQQVNRELERICALLPTP